MGSVVPSGNQQVANGDGMKEFEKVLRGPRQACVWLDDEGRKVREEMAPYWVFYMDLDHVVELRGDQVGKWMCFFTDADWMAGICSAAVLEGACAECKHTHPATLEAQGSGVACFYVNGDDREAHRRLLGWMIRHDLVRRTKKGKLYNIGFKYDTQTLAGEYGTTFAPKIVLSDFFDLETGEFVK